MSRATGQMLQDEVYQILKDKPQGMKAPLPLPLSLSRFAGLWGLRQEHCHEVMLGRQQLVVPNPQKEPITRVV